MAQDEPSVDAVPRPLLRFETVFEFWDVYAFVTAHSAPRVSRNA